MDMLGYGGSNSQKSRKEQERKHGGEGRNREGKRNRERQEGLDVFIIYHLQKAWRRVLVLVGMRGNEGW